jgi:hypothetical protein
MDINPKEEVCNTIQYQEAFLKYVENEYCAKDLRMTDINPENAFYTNFFASAKVSRLCPSSFESYDSSSDDGEYLTPESVAEMTP